MKYAAALVGGPALFILGNIWFKGLIAHRPPLSHLVGLAMMVGAAIVSVSLNNLTLGLLMAIILIVIAAWETVSLSRSDPPEA